MVDIEAVPTYPDSYLFMTYIVLGIFGHLKIRFLATFWVILNTVGRSEGVVMDREVNLELISEFNAATALLYFTRTIQMLNA